MLIGDFIVQLLLFFIVVIFGFYITGKTFLYIIRLQLTPLENLFFPIITGMMIFILIAYVLSFMRIGFIIIPILIFIFLFSIKNKIPLNYKIPKSDLKQLIFIVCLGLILSSTMIGSGKFGNFVQLIGVNASDSLWHLAMIRELSVNFPPDFPGFSVVSLKGYHFFNNFLLAKISSYFGISPFYLFFQFFPILIAYLWGVGIYSLLYAWTQNRQAGLWAVFLTMFGGSFGFIMRILGYGNFNLDDGFGMTQPATALVNPPFATSITVLIAFMFSLLYYCKTGSKRWLVPMALFVGLIAEFKVYAGLIVFFGYFFLTFLDLLKKRVALIVTGVFITLIFYSTYWIYSGNYAGLVFLPLWSTHRLLDANFSWYGFSEKYYTYSSQSVIHGLVEIELFGIFVFIIGSLGTRIIGLLVSIMSFIKKPSFSSFVMTIIVMTIVSILLPLFFIQSIKPFDFIQVTWYFLFFTSLLSSIGLANLFKRKKYFILNGAMFIIIIGMTLPSAYSKISKYLFLYLNQNNSTPYDESFLYLSATKDYNSTVMEIPNRDVENNLDALRKWYRSTSPGLIAFSNKRSFLTYQYFDFPALNVDFRLKVIQKVLKYARSTSSNNLQSNLKKNVTEELAKYNIRFIYAYEELPALELLGGSKKVFQNQYTTVYAINN